MKKCPFCAEAIQDAAIVCRYCGRDLRELPETPLMGMAVTKKPSVNPIPTTWEHIGLAVGSLFVVLLILFVILIATVLVRTTNSRSAGKSIDTAPYLRTEASTPRIQLTPRPILPTAQPLATLPEPRGTLQLGEWANVDSVAFQVSAFEETDRCRGEGPGPATGAKLVYLWLAARNDSLEPIEAPSLIVELSGIDRHAGWFGGTVCRYDEEAFGNACWQDRGRLYPGVECQGWQLLEVPEGFSVYDAVALVSLKKPGKLVQVGEWRLGGSP